MRSILNIIYDEDLGDGSAKVVICNSDDQCIPAILAGLRTLSEEDKKFKSGLKWISVKDLEKNNFEDYKYENKDLFTKPVPPWKGIFDETFGFADIFLFSEMVHVKTNYKDGRDGRRQGICSAEVEGNVYPGEAVLNQIREEGKINQYRPNCFIITKTGWQEVSDFRLLFNPRGAAKISWKPWPGYGNVNFPDGVFKLETDSTDHLMVGRYQGE